MKFIKHSFPFFLLLVANLTLGNVLKVGKNEKYHSVKQAIAFAEKGDTILVKSGRYKEGNISIDKSLHLLGEGMPILDGEMKYEILSFRADNITLNGFEIINSGQDEIKNIGAIRLYDSNFSKIENCIFRDNYFGVYLQRGMRCILKNNKFYSTRTTKQERSGNAIHAWRAEQLWLENNEVTGHKDGMYLEQVKRSYIAKNYSHDNMRYGLHFMFSHGNVYRFNIFKNNSAGVAVMYSSNVTMEYNVFADNWGDAAYGVLLKDLSKSRVKNNRFRNNTTAVLVDGATQMEIAENTFLNNGWGLKLSANSRDCKVANNNFENNTFDISTNGTTVMNEFSQNYWDKYEGYDLDKDQTGDVPYYPLNLYAVLAEKNPSVMLLYRSFFVDLLVRIEKMMPSLTPENFVDKTPRMKPKAETM